MTTNKVAIQPPPAPAKGAPPLTAKGHSEAYVLRRHGGAWQVVVIRVPNDVLDDGEFVLERREPTRLANAVAWVEARVHRESQR